MLREVDEYMGTIGYSRVSTVGQARDGASLMVQGEKITQYCALHDDTMDPLTAIFWEPGVSGKNIKDRPGLQTALELVYSGKVKHFVVYKLDRLGRNTIEVLTMIQAFQDHGVTFHSIQDQLDTSTYMGKFVLRILAALAEMERDQIAERTQQVMNSLKLNGFKVSSQAPYGYRHEQVGVTQKRVDGKWQEVPVFKVVENEAEQACLCELHRLHQENPKWGYRKLARKLAEKGCLNRNGSAFHPERIKAMLEGRP